MGTNPKSNFLAMKGKFLAIQLRPWPLAAVIGAIVAMTPGKLSGRIWTDVSGRKLEAVLVAHDEKAVVLRLGNGRNATVPLTRLSAGDLEFLKTSDGGSQGAGADTPSPSTGKTDDSTGANDDTDLNWDAPWPDSVPFKDDPGIDIVEENAETKLFVYTSSNYRFTSDVRLSKSVVSTFADMFEATRLYCRALPLAISGGVKHDGKYNIKLFAEKDDYIKAGGPPSSGGVFMGGQNVVMVPLISLGVKKFGSGYMRDRDKSDGTLIHELTHQLTPSAYYGTGAKGWFSEGLAEYLTSTPYRSGRFKVQGNLDDIVAYATAYGKKGTSGRGLGAEFEAPALDVFMLMNYQSFTGSNSNFNYAFGLLLTTYFMVLDGDGDAKRLKEFLMELRKIENHGNTGKAIDKLLAGRTFEELQNDVSKCWKRKGIKISFRPVSTRG